MAYGYAASLILLLVALAGITLEKAYFYLPMNELERRGRKGDAVAAQLLRAARYGDELRLLLVMLSWLAATASVVLLVRLTVPAIGVMAALIVLVLVFFWQIRSPLTARGALLAAWSAPILAALLERLHPLLVSPARLFRRYHLLRSHTGIYELDDFFDFLERQKRQRDNRIEPGDLARLQRSLQAGRQTVETVMTPRAQVLSVNADDLISPVLQNELHQSGQGLFPVYQDKRTNIVGTLKLTDITDVKRQGTVGDVADRHLCYVRESDSIERAIRAFYETGQELFIVVGVRAQYVGVVSLDGILKHLFGPLDRLQFGHFDDAVLVAAPESSSQDANRGVE